MALSDFITEVLEFAPNIRCFAVASDDIAYFNSQRLPNRVTGGKRRKVGKQHYARWRRDVKRIIESAEAQPYDDVLTKIKSLPLDAVQIAYDPVEADAAIDAISSKIRVRQYGVGILEEFASQEIVFIWLWQDH